MNISDGMTYAPKGKPSPVVKSGEFVFSAVRLDHGHIYGMCNGLTEAGGTIKYVYDKDPRKVEAFLKAFPTAKAAKCEEEALEDPDTHMIAGAAVTSERCALGLRAMEAGKDYFTDKAPFTTIEQLQSAREAVRRTGKKYVFPDGYIPVIRNYVTGEAVCLEGITESCTSLLRPFIFAKRLERRTHVFTYWNKRGYICGNPGDWIAVHMGMEENVYIIPDDIFRMTYDHETKYI